MRGISEALLLQAAAQLALEGDLRALAKVFDAMEHDARAGLGVPDMLRDGERESVTVSYLNKTVRQWSNVDKVGFAALVAVAFQRPPSSSGAPSQGDDVGRLDAIAARKADRHVNLPVVQWSDDHEALLSSVIRACHAGETEEMALVLEEFYRQLVRTVNHPRIVEQFVEAGLGEAWHFEGRPDDFKGRHPMQHMMRLGNVAGVSRLLDGVSTDSGKEGVRRWLEYIEDCDDTIWEEAAHQLSQATQFKAPERVEQAQVRATEDDVLSMLDRVHALAGDRAGLKIRADVLRTYLERCDDPPAQQGFDPVRPSADVVARLLDSAPAGRLSLRRLMQMDYEQRQQVLGVDEDNRFIGKLADEALRLQAAEVVEAFKQLLREDCHRGRRLPLVEMVCLQQQRKGPQHMGDLLGCLRLLHDVGVPVRDTTRLSMSTGKVSVFHSPVLRLMAEGGHRQQVQAMITAVENGFGPCRADKRLAELAPLIQDKDRREQWLTALRSLQAASSAREAVAEIENALQGCQRP